MKEKFNATLLLSIGATVLTIAATLVSTKSNEVQMKETFTNEEVDAIVKRIAGNIELDLVVVPQDIHLSKNQSEKVRCGDNGIFKGVPLTEND